MNSTVCPKCNQTYSQQNPPKKLVDCSHILCFICLKQQLLCPIDKTRIGKRKHKLEAFLTDNQILQTIRLSKQAEERQKLKTNKKSQIFTNSSKCNKEFTTPVTDKYVPFENYKSLKLEKQNFVQVQLPYLSPEKENDQTKRLTISPKKVRLSFDTCLLHSKKADLVCLQDKCLICANCGLFGQHKLHKIIPYDQFLTQYTKITEQSFRIYEMLKQRDQKVQPSLIQSKIQQIFRDKRDVEVKNIKSNIAAFIDSIKRLQKQLITDLNVAMDFKKRKIMQKDHLHELISKKQQYFSSLQAISNGVEGIFNLDNIGQYINYIDKESSQSYIISEGEYLIVEIDNYYRQKLQTINQEANDIIYEFNFNQDHLKDSVHLVSKDSEEIGLLIQESKKKLQQKSNPYSKINTPHRSSINHTSNHQSIKGQTIISPVIKLNNQQQQLLLGTNSKSGSKKQEQIGKKQISPIQPALNLELQSPVISPYQTYLNSNKQYDNFLKISEITYHQPSVLPKKPCCPHNQSINKSSNNQSGHKRTASKKIGDFNRQLDLSKSRLDKSKSKCQTERQSAMNILGEKSENRKRRKLDLPQKYMKIYEELQKDKLDVLDLGGAFLGEGNILAISQLFTSRCKLKTIKLMNNKIGDDCFPQLISRCRFVSSLNLSYNLLSEKSLQWLQREVQHLGELKNITLSNNKIILRNVRDRLEELSRKGIKISL